MSKHIVIVGLGLIGGSMAQALRGLSRLRPHRCGRKRAHPALRGGKRRRGPGGGGPGPGAGGGRPGLSVPAPPGHRGLSGGAPGPLQAGRHGHRRVRHQGRHSGGGQGAARHRVLRGRAPHGGHWSSPASSTPCPTCSTGPTISSPPTTSPARSTWPSWSGWPGTSAAPTWCKTTPEQHDAIIAYTSQMMHIIAVAVCDDPSLFQYQGFEGDSFRGCTRVAALDVPLWTQLFSMNRPALCAALEQLEDHLRASTARPSRRGTAMPSRRSWPSPPPASER